MRIKNILRYFPFAWVGTRLGILGAVFVAFGYADYANIVWLIGNPMLWYHNHVSGESDQSLMFKVYTGLAIIGVARIVWGLL